MAKPIYIIQILFLPLVWFFTQIAQLTGVKKNFNITEGELVAMLNIASKQGSIPKEEKALIENIFEFDDIEVKDVMTKKDKIDALEIDMTIKEALKKAKSHTHSKMPIYEKNINNIKGIITITQLLIKKDKYGDKKRLSSLKFGPAIIVKPNKRINLLCNIFLKKKIHIAVVQNNKGETLGIVTLEDLIEEIIGEINDKLI